MSTLTFGEQANRDMLVADIVSTVTYRVKTNNGELYDYDIEDWQFRANDLELSEAAVSQVVEEVRQTLNLLFKFSKKRVA